MNFSNFQKLLPILLIFLFIGSIQNFSQASQAEGFGGSISDDSFNKGSTIRFTASLGNLGNEEEFIQDFNVLFREDLGQSATRDPREFSNAKSYDEADRPRVRINQSFTDTMELTIEYDPGSYDVSIYFRISNSTTALEDQWESKFALSNQTIEILGTTQSIQIARGIGYVLGGLVVVIIGLLIYSKITKK